MLQNNSFSNTYHYNLLITKETDLFLTVFLLFFDQIKVTNAGEYKDILGGKKMVI